MARKQAAASAAYGPQISTQPTIIRFTGGNEGIVEVGEMTGLSPDCDDVGGMQGNVEVGEMTGRSLDYDDHLRQAAALTWQAAAVWQALESPEWDWRTPGGIHRATGVERSVVDELLELDKPFLDVVDSPQRGRLVRIKGRKETLPQRILGIVDAILDILSLGKRPIVQP
jgi:hypothetical protein